MKNFPNQANDIARLRATLATIQDVAEAGGDPADDGVLGYELALRRHYTFRHLDYNAPDIAKLVSERLALERGKNPRSQGTRTNAREMRRTLRAFGWLNGDSEITESGIKLLTSERGSLNERTALVYALWGISVGTTAASTSHPIRILLRLLSVHPLYRREGLELALEAQNDSESEWDRVKFLYSLGRDERQRALNAKGISDFQIANAVKIFPTLVREAGLVVEDYANHLTLSPDGRALLEYLNDTDISEVMNDNVRIVRRRRSYKEVNSATVAAKTGAMQRLSLTRDEQQRASQQLADRTNAHQKLVKMTAGKIAISGKLYEDVTSFDLVFVPTDCRQPILLFEIKTIGSNDEDAQIRRGVSQLSWYHFFDVSPHWPDRAVVEVLVVDKLVSKHLEDYLRSEDVCAIMYDSSLSIKALNAADSSQVLAILGQRYNGAVQ